MSARRTTLDEQFSLNQLLDMENKKLLQANSQLRQELMVLVAREADTQSLVELVNTLEAQVRIMSERMSLIAEEAATAVQTSVGAPNMELATFAHRIVQLATKAGQ